MTGRHLLFFEPRTEGHHLMFLQHVVEGLLASNRQITLAIDLRTDNAKAILSEKIRRYSLKLAKSMPTQNQDYFGRVQS